MATSGPGNSHDHDPAHEAVAARLVNVLTASAAAIEPGPDAYTRLVARVSGAAATGPRPWWSRRGPTPRLIVGAAAGALAMAGLVVATPLLDLEQNVERITVGAGAVNRIDSLPPTPHTATTGPPPTPHTATTGPPPTGTIAQDGGSPEAAAAAFLTLIGIDLSTPEVEVRAIGDSTGDGRRLEVRLGASAIEGDDPVLAVLSLEAVPRADGGEGWVVTGATSDAVSLDAGTGPVVAPDGQLAVMGRTHRDATSYTVEVRSAQGTVLTSAYGTPSSAYGTVTTAASGPVTTAAYGTVTTAAEDLPFTVTLDVDGTEPAWIVARADRGHGPGREAFAAVPVAIGDPADPDS